MYLKFYFYGWEVSLLLLAYLYVCNTLLKNEYYMIIIIEIMFKDVANLMSESSLFCEKCFIFKMYRVA